MQRTWNQSTPTTKLPSSFPSSPTFIEAESIVPRTTIDDESAMCGGDNRHPCVIFEIIIAMNYKNKGLGDGAAHQRPEMMKFEQVLRTLPGIKSVFICREESFNRIVIGLNFASGKGMKKMECSALFANERIITLQTPRSWKSVWEAHYQSSSGDEMCNPPPIWLVTPDATWEPRIALTAAKNHRSTANEMRAIRNVQIIQTPVMDLINTGVIEAKEVCTIDKAKCAIAKHDGVNRSDLPKFWPYPITAKRRHLWLCDKYSSGKTAFLSYLQWVLDEKVYKLPEKPNGMIHYTGEPILIMDKFTASNGWNAKKLEDFTDGGDAIDVKYGILEMRTDLCIIIASNYTIEEVYGNNGVDQSTAVAHKVKCPSCLHTFPCKTNTRELMYQTILDENGEEIAVPRSWYPSDVKMLRERFYEVSVADIRKLFKIDSTVDLAEGYRARRRRKGQEKKKKKIEEQESASSWWWCCICKRTTQMRNGWTAGDEGVGVCQECADQVVPYLLTQEVQEEEEIPMRKQQHTLDDDDDILPEVVASLEDWVEGDDVLGEDDMARHRHMVFDREEEEEEITMRK